MDSSLHTRYRPKNFKQVVGHEDIIKSLKRIVKARRAHSFIFSGPAGVGKTSLARILANEFCDGKADQANIEEIPAAIATGVDAVRSIADKARYKAMGENPSKIIILDEAHRLSSQAWDALLKLIEEPPPHVFFIFCTTNLGKIPKTILTRCQHIELQELDESDILKVLKRVVKAEGVDVSEEVLETVAEHSGGSPRQALVNLESCLYCESASEARKVMKQAGETKEVVDLAKLLLAKRGRDWASAQKILKDLKGQEAESIRIVLCNYLSGVLMNSRNQNEAGRVMAILDCFSKPYYPATKHTELILSIGEALDM